MDTFGHTSIPRIISLDYTGTQFEIYNKISRNYEYSFLFESLTGPEELSETSIMGFDPEYIVKGYYDKVTIQSRDGSLETISTDEPLAVIKDLVQKTDVQTYRYLGGAVGIINYDAIRLWEKIPKRHNTTEPIMEFGIYNDGILFDNKQKKSLYFYYDKNRVDEIKTSEPIFGDFNLRFLSPNLDKDEFSKIVEKAKKYIYDGDIFQVVLSRKFSFEGHGDYLKVYEKLRSLNPSPYLYHLKMGKKITIGSSPEMLLRVTNDYVETFPIAGTRKISNDEIKNEQLRQELINDEKELAEHTMLVDLGRNDIGKVCDYGTVRVNKLMEVKKFSHVQHMVTHVVGKLNKNYDMYDAFKAVFPAGTVSGAPKVRAMEIIDELEPESRGPYAGAVGYFSFNGCCDFAIAIRSIFADEKHGFVQAGAGIVFDSVPNNELKETEHKANAMITALREASK
ncbi:MAG: anthranilate synthase component I family protein [Thaumarchaeota archaeon]|jgi:anthranilate synthase component 1|uniref:anthranilate synthase n=3 Tax=Marine Group I thaumarchaeote TaxID=2511932 RepID=A0A7K4MZS4_9ARCH|nr:anthranilate synthase component I family protein [Marine Group I thaumarchaeote]NWJ68737.1 anthranilate synthase component I family protein [Marine Group I thaumarchaeote]PBO83785.1 MAG: anthranilate synthase component I [Nitrosopumilales archaeon]RTZ70847.1 MAG: anthranilate synthase component I family protein [Nitrososphaerota archaeon]